MIVSYLENKKINYLRVQELLSKSQQLNQFSNSGPLKQELEKLLHKLLKIDSNKCVLCVNSGTSALHLLLLFCQLHGKIAFLTPSFNFPSAKCNTESLDINIIDIDFQTYTIPFDEIQSKFYDGFIIPTLFGTVPCNLQDIINYCNQNNKILILDNCSSPFSTFNNKNICNLENTIAFSSTHHTKAAIGFGEGGLLICNKEDYDLFDSLSNFGFKGNRKYNKYSSNFKMSDIAAAFIIQHIENYDLKKHIEIQEFLVEELKNDDRFELFNYSTGVSYGNFPILFKNEISVHKFRDVGIEVQKYYYPLSETHKNSWNLYNKIINFPLNSSLTDYQLEFMIRQIKNV